MATPTEGPDRLFYDGDCGVCHRAVRFVAGRDPGGRFRFAPLGGETFARLADPERRAGLPDSIVVLSSAGALLTRTAATIHVLRRLGGVWRGVAALLALVPRPLRDAAYDLFARHRKRWVAPPDGVCPRVEPQLARRFDP